MNQHEASRGSWRLITDNSPLTEEINSGSLQRIADATEKMASSYVDMERSRNFWKRRTEEESECRKKANRRISALQGVITKLKNKVAEIHHE